MQLCIKSIYKCERVGIFMISCTIFLIGLTFLVNGIVCTGDDYTRCTGSVSSVYGNVTTVVCSYPNRQIFYCQLHFVYKVDNKIYTGNFIDQYSPLHYPQVGSSVKIYYYTDRPTDPYAKYPSAKGFVFLIIICGILIICIAYGLLCAFC